MKIGLVPMSAKPYHAGHDGLVRMAAAECDKVNLYVSLADRERPGEITIAGKDMATIWKGYIEPTLPANVDVHYVPNPVRASYEELGKANETGSKDKFVIYSDPTDLAQNFPEKSLLKYAGNLYSNKQIIQRAVQRTETVNVSGTAMRQYLEAGDKASFVKNLPKNVNGDAIWKLLSTGAKKAPEKSLATKKAKTKKESIQLVKAFIFEALMR